MGMNFKQGVMLSMAGVLAFGAAPQVYAEGGPLSLGVRAVNYVPTDGKGSFQGGLQARLQLPLFFALEGSVDRRKTTFDDTTAEDWPVQISVLTYFLPQVLWVQPFFLVGGGWYNTEVEGPNGFTDRQNRFGPHAGAGLDIHVNDRVFFDATYRYVYTKDLDTVTAAGGPREVNDRGHMVTVGLNYQF
jgi:hypothetical protein